QPRAAGREGAAGGGSPGARPGGQERDLAAAERQGHRLQLHSRRQDQVHLRESGSAQAAGGRQAGDLPHPRPFPGGAGRSGAQGAADRAVRDRLPARRQAGGRPGLRGLSDSRRPHVVSSLEFFATAPRGLEPLLADELRALGAADVREGRGGVAFGGPLRIGYAACLWSRTANRVLLPLARFPAATPEALYAGVHTIDWGEHLSPDATLAVDFVSSRSAITHTQFGAQKVKDAVVDRLREQTGRRPSVRPERPDLQLNVYVHRDEAQLAVDLSGESLHRRGYRPAGAAAPLKENLAAALLLRAGWPALAAEGAPLLDPMCGSGTLPIEAALIAADIAPGLARDYYGFLGWLGHIPAVWRQLREEAEARREAGLATLPAIVGYDADGQAVRTALANVE